MTKFIKLTTEYGTPILVNIDKIIAVEIWHDNKTGAHVSIAEIDPLCVKESYEHIVLELTGGR